MEFIDTLTPYLSKDEIDRLFLSLDGDVIHGVTLNPKKISDEEFLSLCPHAKPHPFVPHSYIYKKEEYDLGKSLLYASGAISIQDPSSMMPAFFLNPKPGSLVLDLCAAPGGKSINLSFLIGEDGLLVANDLSYPRAKSLSANIERMGLGNVIVTSGDYSSYRFPYAFDAILLDAPCSGSAMFRKNEEAKNDWSPEKLSRCVNEQEKLLETAYSLLSPGGKLLYSTCSFSYEENEGVILPFLKRHEDMEAIMLPKDERFFRYKGLPEAIHFFPFLFEGEGQFACLMQKKGAFSPFKKEILLSKEPIFKQLHLENRSNERIRTTLYSAPFHLELPKGLPILRYGIRVYEDGQHCPEFAYARWTGNKDSLPLNEEQAKAYLRGESFAYKRKDGFAIVSYKGRNLGYVKIVQGTAKNHYPKGLRHTF